MPKNYKKDKMKALIEAHSTRPSVGDEVGTITGKRYIGQKGTIVLDDKGSMPCRIKIDGMDTFWFCASAF